MRRCASRLRPLVSLCAAVFAVAVLASPSRADVTDREQEFVYGLNVFTGTEYTGTFAPAFRSVGRIADWCEFSSRLSF